MIVFPSKDNVCALGMAFYLCQLNLQCLLLESYCYIAKNQLP